MTLGNSVDTDAADEHGLKNARNIDDTDVTGITLTKLGNTKKIRVNLFNLCYLPMLGTSCILTFSYMEYLLPKIGFPMTSHRSKTSL